MPQIGMNGLYAKVGDCVKVVRGRYALGRCGMVKSVTQWQDPDKPWIKRLYIKMTNGLLILAHNCEVIG